MKVSALPQTSPDIAAKPVSSTATQRHMRIRLLGIFMVFALLIAPMSSAFATSIGIGISTPIGSFGLSKSFCGDGPLGFNGLTGLGDVMCNFIKSIDTLPGLLAAFSYLAGLVVGFLGILKLKDHVQDARSTPAWEPVKRFAAAGMFFSLPIVTEALRNTFVNNNALKTFSMTGFSGNTGSGISIGPIQINLPNWLSGPEGLDGMLVALMSEIWGPTLTLISAFSYLAGLILVLIGISRLLKGAQDGARGPGGIGTIMTFLTAGALFSIDRIMGAFTSSFFDTKNIATYSILSSSTLSSEVDGQIQAVISAVLAFIIIVGWVSFVRGLFILRDVAEGNGQASVMAAFTHLIGGALAVNLGPLLNAVQSTFGLTSYGVLFV